MTNYTYQADNLATGFILSNRLTAITWPLKHDKVFLHAMENIPNFAYLAMAPASSPVFSGDFLCPVVLCWTVLDAGNNIAI
jgi:hypothetical protein